MDPRQETGERGDRHEGPGAETVDGFHMPEAFTCPECGGVMRRERDGRPRSFRCTVGHVLTGRALWLSQLQGAEYHLWAALRVLEEAASLGHRLVADGDDGIREPGDL
jgi:hypothetical protein